MNYIMCAIAKHRLKVARHKVREAKTSMEEAIRNTQNSTVDVKKSYEHFLSCSKEMEKRALDIRRMRTAHSPFPIPDITLPVKTPEIRPGAATALTKLDIELALVRHCHGDWNRVSARQWKENNRVIKRGCGTVESRHIAHGGIGYRIRTDLATGRTSIATEGERM